MGSGRWLRRGIILAAPMAVFAGCDFAAAAESFRKRHLRYVADPAGDARHRFVRIAQQLGRDVHAPAGVPILELDDGQRLTEGPAILQYLADHKPEAGLIAKHGTFERYRTQEWLNFITSELHKSFYPLFRRNKTAQDWQDYAERRLAERFDWLSGQLQGKAYLSGERFSVADAYLFVVLNRANFVDMDLNRWPVLAAYVQRVAARPKVQEAFKAEGLQVKAAAA